MTSESRSRFLRETVDRLGFRVRLAVLIGSLFTVVGGLVLAAQYLVVSQSLDDQVHEVSIGTPGAGASVNSDASDAVASDESACVSIDVRMDSPTSDCSTAGPPAAADSAAVTFRGAVADDIREVVLARAGVATGVIAVSFALIAAALAWWLAGRPLRRIRQVTQLATATSERDLRARLDLAGPADEIKALGDTFDAMLDRLEHAFVQREQFISNASHELRTPLAAGRAALEAPLSQGRFPPDVVPDVRRALAANARSADLISVLLQLARTDLDPAHAGPVDLADVVEAALDAYSDRVAARALCLRTDLREALTRGNETLLIRAVDNLLDNATRYATPGGDVAISTSARDGSVRISVENDGFTYSPAQASQLREPFHRGLLPRTDSTGHGLGLAIVDAIVRSHHGTLDIRPRSGGGLAITAALAGDDERAGH